MDNFFIVNEVMADMLSKIEAGDDSYEHKQITLQNISKDSIIRNEESISLSCNCVVN